ncbi:MAG: SCO family protein [Chitinophagaceae bacterium]|nr:SCO family protein [Chitinophagaceae bacterium]
MSKKAWLYVVFFALLFGGFYVFLYATIDTSQSRLPVLSNVKPFEFVRQDSVTVTQKDVSGKVYISEFFFTTCPGICPKMNANMKKLYEILNGEKDFMILSHTVDPANDSVARLKYYADSLGADIKNWWFLTGTKQNLYKSARESYIVDDPKNNAENINDEFLHTQFFALVDKKGRVRGVYDGLRKNEMEKLVNDAKELLKEKT